jgi:hypothetical protein
MHGCIYCFARPTHSYLGLSPGLDFESRLFAKVNVPELLRRELAKPATTPNTLPLASTPTRTSLASASARSRARYWKYCPNAATRLA